jgi:hypothetical protein
MARISTYNRDFDVGDYDAWIGTDSPAGFTKQFTAAAVAEYLNIKGKVSISAQMVFKYWTNNAKNTQVPGPGDFYGPTAGSAMASITTMQVYKADVSKQNVVAFMDYIVGSHILISEQNNISTFGHFLIDSYTINDPNDDFYTLNLTNIGGNGNLTELLHYDFAVFTPSSSVNDKSFVFTQGTTSTSWEVVHNLDKFPSITVVDTANTVVFGEYIYNSLNKVTLNFKNAFAGKAYLN